MYKSVFLVLLVIVGCAALGAAPAKWTPALTPALTESPAILEALDFVQVPTKVEEVHWYAPGGVMTDFMLRPNAYQTCGCRVQGPVTVCVCNVPKFGLCPEFDL